MDEADFQEAVDTGEGTGRIVVNRVSIRTPPFSSERPGLWFASLEAQFAINQISKEITKFHYAVAHLDTSCTHEVEDIIVNPPKENCYQVLKDAIISRFSESREQKIRRLLEKEQLDDRKPSTFYRHLKSLAGVPFPEELLKSIWLGRLPRYIQTVLTAQQLTTAEELSTLADKLIEINAAPAQVCSTHSEASTSTVDRLAKQVEELTRAVAALSAGNSTPRGRNRSRGRGRSRSRSRNPDLCFYHDRFAAQALKCVKPCKWSGSPPSGQTPN